MMITILMIWIQFKMICKCYSLYFSGFNLDLPDGRTYKVDYKYAETHLKIRSIHAYFLCTGLLKHSREAWVEVLRTTFFKGTQTKKSITRIQRLTPKGVLHTPVERKVE